MPAGTEASTSNERMWSSRSNPILGNDWTSLATIVGMNPAASGWMSAATTSAPAFAASTAARPSPPPISSIRSPERTWRCRHKKSDPVFGGWTASGTRNRQPRQANRRTPPSLLSKDAPEVEPERFFELGARARRGLRVFELVDVELERNPFALHAVELRREAASLIRFREDDLRLLEGAVLRELLDGLDDDPLDLLGLRRGNRRERGGQAHVCHRVHPSGHEVL